MIESNDLTVWFAVSYGIIGVGLAAGVVALVASGIVAAVAGSRSHRK
jgi:hypothetical protein